LKRISKYIATVLLGIFIFPIVFQPVHIVLHTIREHSSNEFGTQYSTKSTKGINMHKSVCAINGNSETHCLICEYKFSISNSLDNCLFECEIFKIEKDSINRLNNSFKLVFFSKKSPRAPPSFFI